MIKAEKVHDEIYTSRDFNTSPLTISSLEGDTYDYECIIQTLSSGAGLNDWQMTFNSDTTANYRNRGLRGAGTGKTAPINNSATSILFDEAFSGLSSFTGLLKFSIKGSMGDERYVDSLFSSAGARITKQSSYWKNTANELTSITFKADVTTVGNVHIMLYRTPKASEQSNWELMQTLEWSASTTEKSFSGLLGNTDIKYKISHTLDQDVELQINNDGGANYKQQYLLNNAGALSAGNTTLTGVAGYGFGDIFINAETGVKRLISNVGEDNVTLSRQIERRVWYSNTATEVTSLELRPLASATGTAKLYRKIEPSTTGDTLPFEVIETVDITNPMTAVTFSNLLGDSVNLYKLEFLGTSPSAGAALVLTYNGDTGSNYTDQYLYGQSSTVTAATDPSRANLIIGIPRSSQQNIVTSYIYPKSGEKRPQITSMAFQENSIITYAQWYNNTATEITSMTVSPVVSSDVTGKLVLSRLLSTPPPSLFSLNTALLDGSTQYFAAGNPAALQITGDFTASIWVKMDAVSGSSQVFFSKSNSTSNEQSWMIYYTGGATEFRGAISTNGSAFDVAPEGGVPVVSTWYNLVLTYDGSNARLYTNGVLDDAPAYTAGINNSTANVRVGRRGDTGSPLYFDGSVAFPKIWDRALSQTEVTELYNDGNPKCFDLLGSGLKTNLVYSPTLSNWNGATGSELVDNSVSSITTTNQGTTPFTGTGLSVNCNS